MGLEKLKKKRQQKEAKISKIKKETKTLWMRKKDLDNSFAT